MKRWIRLAAAIVVGLTLTAAKASVRPEDQAAIGRVEAYLNSVETMQARFIQVSSSGHYSEGDLYLSRPGRMRLAYDQPTPILIVADGNSLIFHDKNLDQITYLGLDSTPAGILLRSNVTLGGDVTVTEVRNSPGALEISMVQTKDPAAGELTLLFSDKPLSLKQWRVRDAQGQVVTVSLFDARNGVTLAPELFVFHDPRFDKRD